jgi:Type II secretion system (T2SS), protein E, N-terminal domain/GAF domain
MKTRLGHLLTQAGLVTEAQLARALEVQNFAGGRLGTLLLERGALSEDDLGKTLALQHGCPHIPWSALLDLPADTLALLPARFAIKHSAIPLERGEGFVKMTLLDPSDLRVVDELVFVTGKKIVVGVTPEVRIYQALERYYGKLRAPRFAALAEKLSRPARTPSARREGPPSEAPPPAPDFFADIGAVEPDRESRPALSLAPPLESSMPLRPPPPPSFFGPEEVTEIGWDNPDEPQPTPFNWAPADEPGLPTAPETVSWDDTTGVRSKPRLKALEPPPPEPYEEPGPYEEEPPFAPAFEPSEPFEGDEAFTGVVAATERDGIADAVLEALARRFVCAAIFSSRSDGVAGWASAGPGVDASAITGFSATWTEPSVFMNARLSRVFYLGPLPVLPRHDQLAAALGGWPGECAVQPVFIGERPIAFLLVTVSQPGGVTAEDLDFLRELSDAAASSFAKAIRLRKREI